MSVSVLKCLKTSLTCWNLFFLYGLAMTAHGPSGHGQTWLFKTSYHLWPVADFLLFFGLPPSIHSHKLVMSMVYYCLALSFFLRWLSFPIPPFSCPRNFSSLILSINVIFVTIFFKTSPLLAYSAHLSNKIKKITSKKQF